MLSNRLLRVFTDVRPGEAGPALALLCNIFLVLTAYYLIKPVREGWLAVSVISGFSKLEVKAYSSFAQTLLLLLLIPLYAKLAERWPRRHLLERVGLFFLVTLILFWVFYPGHGGARIPYLGIAFYLWVGIFAVTLVAQFWSFAADLYGEERGRRLFPLIAVGGSSGAVFGSWLSERLLRDWGLETFDLLLYAVLPLMLALMLAHAIDRYGVSASHQGAEKSEVPAARAGDGAYRLIWKHYYLRCNALLVFVMFWVMTNGENILFAAVQEALAKEGLSEPDQIKTGTAAFYSHLYFWVNLSGLLLQSFVVSRLQRDGGFRALLLTPPLVSLCSYGAMVMNSGLPTITAAKTAENGVNYSINNTARQVLWLPVSRDLIYKTKVAIDTACVRFGDGLAALTVLLGTRVWHLEVVDFLGVNILLILVWIGLALMVVREHKRLSQVVELKAQ